MKNIKYYLILFISLTFFVSCDPDKVDDGFFENVKVFSQFQSSTLTIPVLEGQDNTQSIIVQVSAPIETSGISVSVDPNSAAVEGEDFTLDTSQLEFTEGKIEGVIVVNPVFETSVLEGKSFTLNLLSDDDEVVIQGNDQIVVTLEKQCPVAENYMIGEYTISDIEATIGPANGTPNFSGTVIIEQGSSQTSRVFQTSFLPGFSTPAETIEISLVCNNLFLNSTVSTTLSCDGGTTFLGFAPDTEAEMTYSDDDDSSFVINYIEDPEGGCGGPINSSFLLTKVE
jgi:hypothetical protein